MNKYRDIVGRINWGLFLVAVAALPFPQVFIRYALVVWLVAWVLELRFLQPLNVKRSTLIVPFCLFALWYAWRALSGLWAPDHRAWSFMMERYMTFALILPVGIWGVNEHYNWRTAAKVLAISSAASVVIYAIFLTILYHNPQYVQHFHYDAWHTDYNNWYECFTYNSSCLKHRLFWCTTLLIASITCFQAWQKPYITIPLAIVMLASIPLSGSRQMIFSLAAVIIIALVYFIHQASYIKHKHLVSILAIFAILAIGTIAFMNHPRMKELLAGEMTTERLTGPEPRVGIWQLALSSPQDYFWTGVGGGQSVNYLEKKYDEHHMALFKERHYHAHNQYLEELMELGIFGLLLFIMAWIAIPICAQGIGRRTAIYFVTICALNMLTDCMWGKFDGIALWAITMIFILMQSKSTKIERK